LRHATNHTQERCQQLKMNDRYKNHQFYSPENIYDYINIQQYDNPKINSENIRIGSLSFQWHVSNKKEKERVKNEWIKTIPELSKVKRIIIAFGINQEFLDIFCHLPNLTTLIIDSSKATDLNPILRLNKLERLEIERFTQLKDITPITKIKLTHLRIENSFKIENYEKIGQMNTLVGLSLNGDTFAPRNLRINCLEPFKNLTSLKHLDLNSASVIDKESYRSLLSLESLIRFDILVIVPKEIKEEILQKHKKLNSGNFVDWDDKNKTFYDDKDWEILKLKALE
jgi:hypothetical protein